jgi:hypothetical protein
MRYVERPGKPVVRHGRRIEINTIELPTAPGRRQKRASTEETFARIPHERGMKLYKHINRAAWVILLELDRLIFKSFGHNPVLLGNQNLKAVGINRKTKWTALRELQTAGVITVEQQGQGAALVTHHWYPIKP